MTYRAGARTNLDIRLSSVEAPNLRLAVGGLRLSCGAGHGGWPAATSMFRSGSNFSPTHLIFFDSVLSTHYSFLASGQAPGLNVGFQRLKSSYQNSALFTDGSLRWGHEAYYFLRNLAAPFISDSVSSVSPVPPNAPDVSPGMNVSNFPEGKCTKATEVSPWYGVYEERAVLHV